MEFRARIGILCARYLYSVIESTPSPWDSRIRIDSPSDLLDKFKEVVTEYWYVFCDNIFCRPIQVFSFHIGTGNYPPICYKLPRYGTHESDVMLNLVGRLDKKL